MIEKALHKIVDRQDLTEEEMRISMNEIMEGQVESALVAAFLTALRMKGEKVSEIVGAAKVMREKSEKVIPIVQPVVDTCGTGGDGANTFNISTASAFVVAGAGIAVAKHGNKAVSSRSGSADVLVCLGVNLEAEKTVMESCLNEVGICFLFAPLMHPAMKYAGPVRKAIGIRTLFNLLGPLTNPAQAQVQVLGVFDRKWTEPLAAVLKDLGSKHAFVVHGDDGLDEITLTGPTTVSELKSGNVRTYTLEPEKLGLRRCFAKELKGGTPEENADIIRSIFEGKKGAQRDVVELNAAAAIAAAKGIQLKEGLEAARDSIGSGGAKEKLIQFIEASRS